MLSKFFAYPIVVGLILLFLFSLSIYAQETAADEELEERIELILASQNMSAVKEKEKKTNRWYKFICN